MYLFIIKRLMKFNLIQLIIGSSQQQLMTFECLLTNVIIFILSSCIVVDN